MTFPFRITPHNDDELYMIEALKEAWKSFQHEEVPIGAVLVKNNTLLPAAITRLNF